MAPNWQIPHPQFSVLLASSTAAATASIQQKKRQKTEAQKWR